MPTSTSSAPLSQGAGYGIVVGLGFGFCGAMMLVTYLLKRYQREVMTSEEFSTAGRSVKTGLIAAAVVSSWTWAATLLQSTTVTYQYGVSGAFWYAAGACVQIILFSAIAIELKKKSPGAHTFLEVMKARYGPPGHITFMVFAILTNIVVTVQLLSGGSAVISYLTGMHPVAACFLLPLSVAIYTVFGGLKATIITDWIHTFILLIIILVFAFTAFASGHRIGSPSKMYDLLVEAAKKHPVDGNSDGSFLTMRSKEGAIFFVINLIGNFGTVYMDAAYWNKAIAAHPAAAMPGYVLGGLAWFAIPFLCATTLGTSALALEGSKYLPSTISPSDVTAGLVLPHGAVALLGYSGAFCAFIMLFMAVTSATSSELIAISTIVTYDVYKAYINPLATSKKLITVSHITVGIYTLILSCFAVGLHYAGVGMGYMYLLMGVIISAGVIPAVCSIFWSKMNTQAAVLSPTLGLICSITAWLVTTRFKFNNVFTVETTGSNTPMLAGNVVALLSPVLFIPVFTYLFKPANYNWKSMRDIRLDDEDSDSPQSFVQREIDESDDERQKLRRSGFISKIICVIAALVFIIIIPMPMYGSHYVFSKKFFTGWITIGFIWLFYTLIFVGLFPIYQGRYSILRVIRGVYYDIIGSEQSDQDADSTTIDDSLDKKPPTEIKVLEM